MTRFGAIVLTIVVALLMVSCVVNSEAGRTPPAITAVSPSSVAAGSADFTVAVSGSNFNTRSVVMVNGSTRATTYISKTQLAARILSGDVRQEGTIQLAISGFGANSTSSPYPLSVTAPQPLQIATTSLPSALVQSPYAASMVSSGGLAPYAWKVASGQLPPGVALDSSSGILNGVPAQSGKYSFTAQITDSSSTTQTAFQPLDLAVTASTLVLSSATLPNGTVQVAYSASLSASGGITPYAWSVISGALPPGILLSASTGALSGTPSQAGGFSFTVQVKDSAATPQAASASFTLTIAPAAAPTISGVSPNAGSTSGGTLVTISGSNFKAGASALFGATASPNVLVSSATQIQATTPALAAGTVSVSVKNPDGQTATSAGAFTFGQGLLITTSSLPNGTLNSSYSASLAAAGGSTPYTWSYSGTLPHCVALSSAGQLSGTPCMAGSYSFTIMAMDASSASTAKLFDVIISGPVLTIATTSLPAPFQSTPYSATLLAGGGTPPFTWSISSGQLPSGLTLDPSTGTISGTPTATGSFSFTAQVNDVASGQASAPFTLNVVPPGALVIKSTSLADAFVGQAYSATIVTSGGILGFTWSLTSGQLPAGLSLNATSGQIVGTPTTAGVSTFIVKVTDSTGSSASQVLALNVNPPSATDQYGGYTSLPSPNGGTGFFRAEKFTLPGQTASRWMLVTPAGNAFWMRSVYAGNGATAIDSTVLQSKYGGDSWSYYNNRNQRYLNWGFNTIGEFSSSTGWPVGAYGSQTGNSPQLPFNIYIDANFQVLRNPGSVGLAEPVKDILRGVSTSTYNTWRAPLIDFYDPKFAQAVAAEVGYWNGVVTGGFANKPWVVCVSTEDADDMWGFKSGGNAPVVNYPHPVFLIATTKFQYTSAESWTGSNWIDSKLYTKYAWLDWLKAKYGNSISNLNAAWGTNGFYTSFDDAGGYGTGTGVIDEDGRHTAWMGSDPFMLSNASVGLKVDLDAFLYEFAKKFASVEVAAIRAVDQNHQICGPMALNNYGAKTRDAVLRGLSDGGIQVFWFNYDPSYGPQAGSMADNNKSYDVTGKPILLWYSVTAQADSEMSSSPVIYGQPNFPTQVERGAHMRDVDMPNFLNARGANGDYYVVGYGWWQLVDNGSEGVNWGLVTFRDNAYDGIEAVVATSTNALGLKVGGEVANYGDAISGIKAGNFNVLQSLLNQIKP